MMLVSCPWCGPRNEDEFTWGGEASRMRPDDPSCLTDEQWADYMYNKDNEKGWVIERWWHARGCEQWFEICRNNVNTRDCLHRTGWRGLLNNFLILIERIGLR